MTNPTTIARSLSEAQTCDECGLPLVECGALAVARERCETWLRDIGGYDGLRARNRAAELIPEKRAAILAEQEGGGG